MRKPTEGGKRVPSAFLAQAYNILVAPEHDTFPVPWEAHFLLLELINSESYSLT